MSAGAGADIRRSLDHPVIDADGHWLELFPVFYEFVDEVAGARAVDAFRERYGHRFHAWYAATPEERQARRMRRPSFWGVPTRARERIAVTIPAALAASLDEWGIDLSIVFPTIGLTLGRDLSDPDLSAAVMRAYNVMVADLFAPYRDRIVPAGVVSLAEPTDAIEQLDHAHGLGLTVLATGGTVARPLDADAEWQPDPAKRRTYIDGLGLDSPYDYDPVWQRFVDLGIPVTSHSGSMGWSDRSLPSSFVGNHLGHFAQSHHAFARCLFLGGVTERFPTLRVAFLEGGVGWASNLYSDLFGHWEKRNKRYLDAHLRPTNIDREEYRRLYETYSGGHPRFEGKVEDVLAQNLDALESEISQEELAARDLATDEFAAVRIDGPDDIRRLFAERFYFGCEADDPLTSLAFDQRLGLPLKPVFGSDIGHFDVVDPSTVLGEAWEMVDDGLVGEADFRAFTFTNVVELYRSMNPEFFVGTVIEDAAEGEYARRREGEL